MIPLSNSALQHGFPLRRGYPNDCTPECRAPDIRYPKSGDQDTALGSCAGKIRWGVQIPSAVQKGINIYEHQCFAKNPEEAIGFDDPAGRRGNTPCGSAACS